MNSNAVSQATLKRRFATVSLATATMLFVCLGGVATAAQPVGKDGQIHACYRTKGRSKGAVRIVPSAKKRCKRGERKVTWSAAGAGGQAGSAGQTGTNGGAGQQGSSGTNGSSSSNEAVLKTEIAALTVKLGALEGILGGITHNDLIGSLATLNGLDNAELLGAVDAVKGLTNTELTDAVASLPVVSSLCNQSEGLTDQVNLVGKGVSEIALGGILPVGLKLELPTLTPLGTFTC